jgi:S1-C subfamily serine protease
MVFCINCGSQNAADAVFCCACGQTLYRGPHGPTSNPRPTWKRFIISIVIVSLTLISAVAIYFFLKKPSGLTNDDRGGSKESPRAVAPINDKAVLLIVASNRSGSKVTQGSGFILTSDGLAGTNYHVVEGATKAVARCCGGHIFEIRSIEGADLKKDLVTVQLYEENNRYKPVDLPHVTLGSSQSLSTGERVIVIGSPEGLENSLSDGVLSAVRESEGVRYLQITAPISPGSSGGPVLDANGDVVGVATFQFEKGQNLNFAVAVEHLRPLLDQHLGLSIPEFRSYARGLEHEQPSAATSNTTGTPPANPNAVARQLTGAFSGIVHNLSSNVSAEFGILINDTGGFLSGCMGVNQPLFGSGPLFGNSEGQDVSFTVVSAIGTITFVGSRENGEIDGTYIVEHDGSPNEDGTFTLRKVNSKGPAADFDTANCPTDAEMNQ